MWYDETTMETITSRDPATGETLGQIPQTPLDQIPVLVAQARAAQQAWSQLSPKDRMPYFINAREHILDNIDSIAELISRENGKPRFEAMVNDIIPTLDLLTQYAKRAPKLLKDQPIPMRIMKHRKSYLHFWPKGVVAIIAPWNFPFSIPLGEIALALMAGNAVIFKPSEVTPLIGRKIVEIFEHACLPKHLLQLVVGDPSRGAALVKAKLDKIFFTGSVATGKKVMAAASETLTPVVLELGGKDPMVVMPDADIDFATSAALWGGFANSGQVCASTERVIVHESIHDQFVNTLKSKVGKLRHGGHLGEGDLGVATYEKQKEIYAHQLAELSKDNSSILHGGKFSKDHTFLEPTIVTNPPGQSGNPIEKTKIYQEETFGPVVAVTKFKTTQEAIEKANDTKYGLLASVISKDVAMAEQLAKKIEAGSVLINEVLYTHGLAETPWGGVKDSGFGRVHSDLGFLEFVNVRHIHKPKWWAPLFKSLWWFPYTPHQTQMFRKFAEVMFRRSLTRRLKALPDLIVAFTQMIKTEKRL
ncbi:MAG: aldehyde dehydrogenase family protein [Bdellovibrionota bacterium]